MRGYFSGADGSSCAALRALAGQLCAAAMVAVSLLTGTAPTACAFDDPSQPTRWTDSAVASGLDPADPNRAPNDQSWSAPPDWSAVAAMIPDPGYYPGHPPSAGAAAPLSAEQEARLRQAADFYLPDGTPNGTRASLVSARHIITGGPSTQDWIDAARHVGGFVVQTSAAVVAVAGRPATSGATCLIATALANSAGACLDGCDAVELAVNVAAIGIAVRVGFAINSAGLNQTENVAARLLDDAGSLHNVVDLANRFLPVYPVRHPGRWG